MRKILQHLKIHYEPLDSGKRVLPSQVSFWNLLGRPLPDDAIDLYELFPELVGLERDIDGILDTGESELRIPAVNRNGIFFDLLILPIDPDLPNMTASARGIAALVDVTEALEALQVQAQGKNDISILTQKLEERNAELSATNERLDALMNLVRRQNHDLELKVWNRTKELHESRLSIITTLARVAEFRDQDTGGHIHRIGRSCVLIGKRHGLSSVECERLFYSSLLHDVGKIGIPDSILLKPASLSVAEWDTMMGHTRIGASLLSRDEHSLFASAREVALHHHEKWDGSGYPDGLAGERISLMSRICAVADVFDALTADRPYKRAWSEEQALDHIRSESGRAFDPSIVATFMDVLNDILTLRDNLEDLESLPPDFD